MRGGLAGAGTATVPWGHRSLVHPPPFWGWNLPFTILINYMQTAGSLNRVVHSIMLLIYMEILYRILYSSSQDLPCYAT